MRLKLTYLVFFFTSYLFIAQESKLVLDSKEQFKFIQEAKNINFAKNKQGKLSIQLNHSESIFSKNLDLQLNIVRDNVRDLLNNYTIDFSKARISSEFHKASGNALIFYSYQNPIHIKPTTKNAFFASNNIHSDFTIEFWAYRTTSTNGETLLSWNGYITMDNSLVDQSIRFETESENFSWIFNNVFIDNFGKPVKIKIKSNEKFIAKAWHLHTLRYKQKNGFLEYLIDGEPQVIKYITNDGNENIGYFLNIGYFVNLSLGKYFTGAIENFKIYKDFIEPNVSPYSKNKGFIITKPIKLSKNYSQILSLDFDYKKEINTDLVYYYRVDDKVIYEIDVNGNVKKNLTGAWIHFNPELDFPKIEITKYIQIKVELYPDGTGNQSPSLYSIVITYVSEPVPAPPVIIKAKSGSEEIFLEWMPVVDENIKGYYIYFGLSPKNYHGKVMGLSSPVDVGNRTAYKLTGLENGRLYYITVVAYNKDKSINEASFSTEVSLRPLEVLKDYE